MFTSDVFFLSTVTCGEYALENMIKTDKTLAARGRLNTGTRQEAGKPGEKVILELSRVILVGKETDRFKEQ